MTTSEFTDAQRALYEKVRKLLDLAANNPNENEAAAATAKAQALLAQYNLDAALVERAGSQDGKREDVQTRGGFYQFQRDLWSAVAELNFCLYWTQQYWDLDSVKWRRDPHTWKWYKATGPFRQKRHRIVGKVVNTAATKAMAAYLEEAIERIVREKASGNQKFSAWAISFREGCVDRILEMILERRKAHEAKLAAEARKAAKAAKAAGFSSSRALTIADVSQTEKDANADFLYGEGWSAQQREARAKAAEREARAEAEWVQWCKDNPDEVRKMIEAERKEQEKREKARQRRRAQGIGPRYSSGLGGRQKDMGGYYAGYEAAEAISLEPQVAKEKPKAIAGASHG